MDEERRYDDQEVAEILDRATSTDPSLPQASTPGPDGLTLSQLQEIGAEVGIPSNRIAEAAGALDRRREGVPPRTFLGAPRFVSRTVPIPRALDEEEWTRLVVDLRETFDALGQVSIQGPLRTWYNGNLQVSVEPDGQGHRVRMRTLKGNVLPRAMAGGVSVLISLMLLLDSLPGAGWSEVFLVVVLATVGLGLIGTTRMMLPGWARERAAQMEGLAQRIPTLLGDRPSKEEGSTRRGTQE